MTTGYVVLEIGYEYNDEFYYKNGDNCGTPTKIYLDKNKALHEVNALNERAILEIDNICEYAEDIREIIHDVNEFERILKNYDKSVDADDSHAMGESFRQHFLKFNSTDKRRILRLIKLEFFSIQEVEIDENSLPPKTLNNTNKISNF